MAVALDVNDAVFERLRDPKVQRLTRTKSNQVLAGPGQRPIDTSTSAGFHGQKKKVTKWSQLAVPPLIILASNSKQNCIDKRPEKSEQ